MGLNKFKALPSTYQSNNPFETYYFKDLASLAEDFVQIDQNNDNAIEFGEFLKAMKLINSLTPLEK